MSVRSAWRVVRAAGLATVAVGAVLLVFAHVDLAGAANALLHASHGWLLIAALLQCASLTAYVFLQRWVLAARGVRIRLRPLWCTVVLSDAIASTVPVVGTPAGMAYSFREFRRAGVPARTAGITPVLGAAVSVIAFVDLAALGGLLSGERVLAWSGLLVLVAEPALYLAVVRGRRGPDRNRDRHLDRRALGYAVLCGISRWLADALSLAAVVAATGAAVPWHHVALAWAAGAAMTTLGLTPNGVGTADAAIVAVLVGAGLPPAAAIAASVLYRVVLLKPVPRIGWLVYRQRRLAKAGS